MQTCPFCNFDAGDRPLHEGRCPQCGNIVQWSDEDIAATLINYKPAPPKDEQPPVEQAPVEQSGTEALDIYSDLTSASGPANELLENDSRDSATETPPLPSVADKGTLHAPGVPVPGEPVLTSDPGLQTTKDALSEPVTQREPAPDNAGVDKSTPALLSQIWEESLGPIGDVRSTLKGQQSDNTVSDTVFSIQTREVHPVSDTPSDTLDYELLNVIGQGGVGVVYAARQASIDRNVALKMLREEYRHREDHRDKFLAEAVLTGELDHPNIVPIYDLGRSPTGELFYSMKNVIGTPWDRVIGTKSLEENLDILLKVSDAIAFAHSRGVVHRDLKPENVMLGNFGEVLVMDWGIALPTAEFRKSASILRSQAMGGTPAYMAPEMAKGPIETIGPASDVYLLGALLFEILTGQPPHYGRTVMECVANAAKNIICETKVTGELMEIAMKCMSTLVRRRYRCVQDFQAAIRLYQSHSESISLSDNAEQQLADATKNLDYQKFSQAVFAFQESLALWPDNTPAQQGLSQAKIQYATTALKKGDYDLGLSLLDANEVEHQVLIDKLNRAIADRDARQNRLKSIRRVAIALGSFIVVAGIATMITIFQLYQDAKTQKEQAELAKIAAISAKGEADEANTQAQLDKQEALKQKEKADKARHNTEIARLESIAERRRAEESGYLAETGLIGASITQNNFAIAKSVLESQRQSASKSKLRHWEWGRFQYLVQGGDATGPQAPVVTNATVPTLETVDCTLDGSLVVVGLGDGHCQLWNQQGQQVVDWPVGRTIVDIDFDHSSQLLATCGHNDERQPCVRIWKLRGDQPPEELQTRVMDRQPTTISFSNETANQWLVIGDDRNTARVWDWKDNKDKSLLLGHNDAITAARFSPDNAWVATSSLDGTVRIFAVDDGKEAQRFSGHRGAVQCLAFAPDGVALASGGEDQRILIWPFDARADAAKQIDRVRREVAGQIVPEIESVALAGHTGTVRDLNFTNDGARLVSGGNDNLIIVWQLPKAATSPTASGPTASAPTASGPTAADRSAALELLQRKKSAPQVNSIKLRGHGGWVHSALVTGAGTQIISGADDYSWRIWNVDQYREYLQFGQNSLAIADAEYTPDGKSIVLALADGTVQLWDRQSGQLSETFTQGHDYLTNRAQLMADDQQLITAAGDNTLRIWDVARGNQLRVLDHTGRNAAFGLSRDGRWLITTGDETGVGLWNLSGTDDPKRYRSSPTVPVATSSVAKRPPAFNEPTCVAITDDGDYFLVGDKDGRCEFWQRSSGTKLESIAGHAESLIAAFALPANHNSAPTFLTAGADGTVAWWDAASGKEVSKPRLVHRAAIHLAVLSPDDSLLATAAMLGSGKARMWLWDLQTKSQLATIDTEGKNIQDLSFRKVASSDSLELIVTTTDLKSSDKEMWIWKPQSQSLTSIDRPQWMSASVWGTVSTSDMQRLIIYGGRGARLWRWTDGKPVMQYRPSSAVTAVTIAADGRLMASGNEDGSIVLWDLASRKPTGTLLGVHQRSVKDLAFSPDGGQLASACQDGLIGLWSTSSGLSTARRSLEKGISANAITFSADGRQLAIGADDEFMRIHDTETLAQVHKMPGHSGPLYCCRFSPDGRWLVTGGEDKSLRIWSAASGQLLATLLGHSAAVTSVDVSSDGLRIVSGSRDTTAKVWDTTRINQVLLTDKNNAVTSADIGEMVTLERHTADIVFVQFSPSGTEILSAGKDGQAVVWPATRVPLALRLSSPVANYKLGSGPLIIDPAALISQCVDREVAGARLNVSIVAEELNMAAEPLPADFRDRVAIDTSDQVLIWKDNLVTFASTGRELAKTTAMGNGMEIEFAPDIKHEWAQVVVRHLNYEANSNAVSKVAQHSRTLKFALENSLGESGNAEEESLMINLTDPNNSDTLPSELTRSLRSTLKSAALEHVQTISH